jgi:hypothetical protein
MSEEDSKRIEVFSYLLRNVAVWHQGTHENPIGRALLFQKYNDRFVPRIQYMLVGNSCLTLNEQGNADIAGGQYATPPQIDDCIDDLIRAAREKDFDIVDVSKNFLPDVAQNRSDYLRGMREAYACMWGDVHLSRPQIFK